MRYKHSPNWRFFLSAAAGVMAAGSVSPLIPYAQGISFSDVTNKDYYFQAVSSLSERGIIKGYGNGIFKPEESVTRAQAAKMLALALNLRTDHVKDPGFKDVSKNNWAYRYIAALAERGIIKGYGDQYKPNEPITRAQMAKIIALGYKFKESPLKDKRFQDVNPTDWYAGYLQPLIEKGITNGTTAKTYSPNETVSRGQMAAFIYRSELAAKPLQITAAVSGITDHNVVTDKGTFSLSANLKTWFNVENAGALKGANITFSPNGDSIDKFLSVELTAGGQAGSNSETYNHITLNGKNALINTDLIVNSDFTILKDMKINGNLETRSAVQHSFYTENISVSGKTIVSDGAATTLANSDKFYNSLSYKIAQNRYEAVAASDLKAASRVVFRNSSLGELEISKGGAIVEATGETKADSVLIRSKTRFTAESQTIIPKITIEAGVESVEINSNVEEVRIIGNGDITISGNASFGQMAASSASIVRVESTGQVGLLKTVDKDSRFILGRYTRIADMQLPAGVEPAEAISNYESVKNNIQKIGGKDNPDYVPGGATVIPNRAPAVAAEVSDQNLTAGSAPFSIELGSVFTDPDGDALQLTAVSSAADVADASLQGATLLITAVTAGASTITVTADDGRGGIVYESFIVNVEQPNSIPVVANEIADQTAVAGTAPITVDLSNVFMDADHDSLTITAESSNSGVAAASADGTTLTLTPSAPGTAAITVKADDGRGGTVEESFTITVEQPNRAPVVAKEMIDQKVMAGGPPMILDLSQVFGDADGDALTMTAASSDSTIASAEVTGNDLKVTVLSAGTATITVKADDGRGGTVEESFTITAERPNHAPILKNEIVNQTAVAGDEPSLIDLTNVFEDIDGDTLTITAGTTDAAIATAEIIGTSLKLTPLNAGRATIIITAADGRGGSQEESFYITVEQPNRAPVVAKEMIDQKVMAGGPPMILDLSQVFGDADGDALTMTAASSDSTIASAEVAGNDLKVTVLSAGTATITVKADDGRGGTVEESFTITIEQPNRAPVVAKEMIDQKVMAGGPPMILDLSQVFGDADGDALTMTAASSDGTIASAEVAGNDLKVTVLSAGTATITVKADDGRGGTVEESFTITIERPNRAPVLAKEIVNQTAVAGEAPFMIDISNVFSDPDGDKLTLTAISNNSGIAAVEVNGTYLKLTPLNKGRAVISVTAADGRGGSEEESFFITVEQPNHAPSVKNEISDQKVMAGGPPILLDLNGTFGDEDGDALTITASTSDSSVAEAEVDGTTLKLTTLSAGTTTVKVKADDGRGGTVEESFTVTIEAPNRAPIVITGISDQTVLTGEPPFTVDLSNVFEDADGDTLTLTATSSNVGVSTAVVSGTDLKLTALNAGTATINVKADDGRGGTAEESFIITIKQPNSSVPEETAPSLFISETIWGGFGDFALEIYNPTVNQIDLTKLTLVLADQKKNFREFSINQLGPGQVLSVVDDFFILEDFEIPSEVLRTSFDLVPEETVEYVNIQLEYDEQIIDSVKYYKNKTMVRNSGVTKGSTMYDENQWTQYPIDDFKHIGTHDFTPVP
ncbi:Ig-like domain-containing protein [Bacillus infantis]|nr:S-layer homology domain-containing protein [Bacillus infantis]